MSRKDEMIAKFDASHHALVELVESASTAQWIAPGVNHPTIRRGEDEHRPVGVIVHHVAVSYERLPRIARAWIDGTPPPMGEPGSNEKHAAANPNPNRDETLALLESRAAALRQFVHGLSDADLEAKGQWFSGELTVAQLIGDTVPYHTDWHRESVLATWAVLAKT
jgi:hypothetical protein